jgi:hypothetical protein
MVRGTVTDVFTGAPIEGATVIVDSPAVRVTAKTDRRGFFIFMALPPGAVTVAAEKDGYVPFVVRRVCVESDVVQEVALSLATRGIMRAFSTYPAWKC